MLEGPIDIFHPFYWERFERDACAAGGHFRRTELNGTDRRVPQNRQTRKRRHGFPEKLDLFTSQLRKIEEHSGKISSGASDVLNPSIRHGIVFKVDANDRDSGRGLHSGPDRIRVARKNDAA